MKLPLIIFIGFYLIGCKTDQERILLTSLSGKVVLYDVFGESLEQGLNGTKIVLSNGQVAITDEKGLFNIKNVSRGKNSVTISKTGFINYEETFSIESLKLNRTFGILEIPTIEISDVIVGKKNGYGNNWFPLLIDYKINPVDNNYYKNKIKIFIGSEELDYDCNSCWSFSIVPNSSEWNQYEAILSEYNLKSININKGDSVSIVIYPYSAISFKNDLNETIMQKSYGKPSNLLKIKY